jgi:hypothetical protein
VTSLVVRSLKRSPCPYLTRKRLSSRRGQRREDFWKHTSFIYTVGARASPTGLWELWKRPGLKERGHLPASTNSGRSLTREEIGQPHENRLEELEGIQRKPKRVCSVNGSGRQNFDDVISVDKTWSLLRMSPKVYEN